VKEKEKEKNERSLKKQKKENIPLNKNLDINSFFTKK